jgi:signal transduction histidine kinase
MTGPLSSHQLSFASRLSLVLAALLLAYGAMVAVFGQRLAHEQEEETLQRLSYGLAAHIVGHWPEIVPPSQRPPAAAPAAGALTRAATDEVNADVATRKALLSMLMTVNPGVQVYLLDAQGRVQHYIGEPGMVRQEQVDLVPIRAFLAGAPLPLRGTDPMGSAVPRIFSAAMFAPGVGDVQAPGYLYVVLDGLARAQVAGQLSAQRFWRGAAWAAAAAMVATLFLGLFLFRRLTLPLRRLAVGMAQYNATTQTTESSGAPTAVVHTQAPADEVLAIDLAFVQMQERITGQAVREQQQVAAHREMMASVAHDLRTPLTALHGHLEALASDTVPEAERRTRVLQAALAQSTKVSRLSQQLFELAALQSSDQVLHRERFSLDELVTDAVQKFDPHTAASPVMLDGVPPGRLELDGDLHLIERALTNLIDNAVRHAPSTAPVRVSLRREGAQALIWVEDTGPGLPDELHARLDQGLSLRDPPVRRSSGGIGGLGLAIAQRVAQLHGGSLRPLPAPQGGTRLCLALPLVLGLDSV